ncbi:papain family cysteine protease [Ancylostoma duodenale]|uniref:Papain family cysteine protease n=1 Tax=Ancylostoma duodenale TaxID=51022 RepID=A0A0C2C5T1_9BILA|nr:papain family cysteine protease [Ancylostoma duodenale]
MGILIRRSSDMTIFIELLIFLFITLKETTLRNFTRCRGGANIRAWKHVMRNGVCTGGPYGYKHGCRPYAFHPCGVHKDQVYYGECPAKSYDTPECRKICQRGYPVTYSKDRYYGNFIQLLYCIFLKYCKKRILVASAYFVKNDTKAIMREIMRGGPVHASYDTYRDFRLYRGGVYEVCSFFFKKTGNKVVSKAKESNVL